MTRLRLSDNPPRKPTHPITRLGIALFGVSCVAALWLSDWRWVVTGFVLMLVAAAVAPAAKDDT